MKDDVFVHVFPWEFFEDGSFSRGLKMSMFIYIEPDIKSSLEIYIEVWRICMHKSFTSSSIEIPML